MATPQAGIFTLGTRTHVHLEFDLVSGAADAALAAAIGRISDSLSTVGGVNVVIGFGSAVWSRLGPTSPEGLSPFTAIEGLAGHRAASTQHDVWLWIHGTGNDTLLDVTVAAVDALADVAVLAAETTCFVYHDSRDLTGFIDGTENPTASLARSVACVDDGQPGAGGAHVLAQRWIHDLPTFWALPIAEQEDVFGRRKPDGASIPREQRPATAHIMRAELLDDEGEERPIYRRSVPYGTAHERGLFFLAFCGHREVFDGMLSRMYGTSGDGIHDRMLDFTRAVSGAYYFAPSVEDLVGLATVAADVG